MIPVKQRCTCKDIRHLFTFLQFHSSDNPVAQKPDLSLLIYFLGLFVCRWTSVIISETINYLLINYLISYVIMYYVKFSSFFLSFLVLTPVYLFIVDVEVFVAPDLTHTHTLGRTPLDERSARRRDLYLTTHNTHNRQISMAWRGWNPQSQQASGRIPTLYRAATGIHKCPISIKLTGCFLIFHAGSERRIVGFSQLNNDNYNNTITTYYAFCPHTHFNLLLIFIKHVINLKISVRPTIRCSIIYVTFQLVSYYIFWRCVSLSSRLL